MSLRDCAGAVAKELGLSKTEVDEIVERLQDFQKRQQAEGRLDNAETEIGTYALDQGNMAKMEAQRQRKHAALNVLIRKRMQDQIDSLVASGRRPDQAITDYMVGSVRGMDNARKSTAARRIALESQWLEGLWRKIDDERPHIMKLRNNKTFLDDVVREMSEIREGGNIGRTGNDDAKWLANHFATILEEARVRMNDAGAFVGKLEGYMPHQHDAGRMMKITKNEWVDFIRPKLDLDKTFENLPKADRQEVLGDIYDTITTGERLNISQRQKGEAFSPANLAKSIGRTRFLHFKTADDWITYQDQFGTGHVFKGIIDNLARASRNTSLLETLGPNPEVMLGSVIDEQRKIVRKNKTMTPEQKNKAIRNLEVNLQNPGTSSIGRAFQMVDGTTNIPVSLGLAKLGIISRTWQSMSKLGSAFVSSLADPFIWAQAARYQGKTLPQAYSDVFVRTFRGKSPAEKRDIAKYLDTGFSFLLGDVHSRYLAEDMAIGSWSRGLNHFFRISGLTGWTDHLLTGFVHMASRFMSDQTNLSFANLTPEYKNVLSLHGLDAQRWELVRKTTFAADDGVRYVIPEMVRELDSADIARAMNITGDEARVKRLVRKERTELESDLRSFFADEARFAVIHGDDRTRMWLTQGQQPGTALGEAIRSMMQFKTFTASFTQKVLGRAIHGRRNPSVGQRAGDIAHIVAASVAFGYFAMTMKDLSKNKTPRDPTDPQVLLAAAMQGGGLGIYGDFLFGRFSRFGNGPLETLAGPSLGTAADVVSMMQGLRDGETKAGDVFWFGVQNTPFLNLWWMRAGLDYLVLRELEELASPGSRQRREQRAKEQFGQEPLLLH